MIVAGLQLDIAWRDPRENFGRAAELAERAVASGARLLALPEMFATGFCVSSPDVAEHGEAARAFLAELASRLGVWLIGGYAEAGRSRPSNSCSLMAPDGSEVLHYRKIHPFSLAGEGELFEAGDRLVTATVDDLRVTPLICYDLRFPELFRAVAVRTDLYVVIANWPERRGHAWRTLLSARAIDGQAWVLGVNRVGVAEGVAHSGDSALIDPYGRVATGLSEVAGVVVGEATAGEVREVRQRFGFLADRRPALYGRLEATDDERPSG